MRQAEEAKQPQGRVTINTDRKEVVDDPLWLMHPIFISVVMYVCLSGSAKIFVQCSKRQHIRRVSMTMEHKLQRERKENGRMEEK